MVKKFMRAAAAAALAVLFAASPVYAASSPLAAEAAGEAASSASEAEEQGENVISGSEGSVSASSGAPAEGEDGRSGSLTIEYFDDSEKKVPVSGAEFHMYKIADLTADGGYAPIDDFFSEVKDADSAAETVAGFYAGRDQEKGADFARTTGDDGLAVFDDVPLGLYYVCETKAAPWHLPSSPFLVNLPETEDGASQNYDVHAEPKANITGNVLVTKKVAGTDAGKDRKFHFTVTVGTDHACRFQDAAGASGTFSGTYAFDLADGETCRILDVPEGTAYEIREDAADGYETSYENGKGEIEGKKELSAVVTNTKKAAVTQNASGRAGGISGVSRKSSDVQTGDRSPVILLLILAASLAVFIFIWKKKGAKR